MAYFARRIQLDKHLGSAFKFEAMEIGEEAPTFKEAVALVEKDLQEYIKSKKEQMKKKTDNEVPFPDDLHSK